MFQQITTAIPRVLIAFFATVTIAPAFDPDNPDLPAAEALFNGNGSRTSGIVKTYNIPLTNFPETIHFSVRGADGGNADAGPAGNRDKFQGKGGGGALANATFSISSTAVNALRPGGEIRIIVGNKGAHKQGAIGGTVVAAGGGGGSGVLYKGPEVNADWIPLMIAGAGGGGFTSSNSTLVVRSHGGHGQLGPIGSTPGSVFPSPGNAGQSIEDRGEGGAGWEQSAYYGAGKGKSNGGVGGESRFSPHTSTGGFGCGGGGGSGGATDAVVFKHLGGGGGGGYSGGGGGNTIQAGGGGGSLIHHWAINDDTRSVVQRAGGAQLNGQIQIEPSSTKVPDSNANPIVTLLGGDPQNVAFSLTDSYVDPGATARDFYGNTISQVQVLSNNVNRAASGNYKVEYETTDQFGQTTRRTRAVTVLPGSYRPTFNLQSQLFVDPSSPQAHNVISDFDAGWLGGQAAEELVRYEIFNNSNTSLFDVQPSLSNDGTLSFTPKAGASGNAVLTVIAIDNGPDPSAVQSLPEQMTIVMVSAPEPPLFVLEAVPLELGTSVEFVEDTDGLVAGTILSLAPESSPELTYSLSGPDADRFTLGESDGLLTFITRPNYDTPSDVNADRVYEITVTAGNGVSSVTSDLTVQLLNASPATFTVTNNLDAGAGSLRQALIDANSKAGADFINFDPTIFNLPQTIALTSGHLTANGSVTIFGPGENLLTIDGVDLNRFLYTKSGTVVVNDLTVTNATGSRRVRFNNQVEHGGAILNAANLTLNRVTITNCSAIQTTSEFAVIRGGAIYNEATLTINDSTLSNNKAKSNNDDSVVGYAISNGGAIFNSGSLTINSSVLTGNQASTSMTSGGTAQLGNDCYGGAIYNLGTTIIDNSVISSNTAIAFSNYPPEEKTWARGGGIYSTGSLTIRNGSVIANNLATADATNHGPSNARGGGIYHRSGSSLRILDSTVTGNIAESKNSTTGVASGGAIFSDNSTTQIRNSEISSNSVIATTSSTAEAYGGGIYSLGLTIWNSTLSGNSAVATAIGNQGLAEGGGLRVGANTTISNSTIVGNSCSGTAPLARGNGGGVFAGYGNAILRNTTIAFNTAEGAGNLSGGGGGGLEVGASGTVDLGNSIVCGNTVLGGSLVYGPDLGGTIGSAGYNLVGDPTDASGLTATDLSGFSASAVFFDTNSDTVIDLSDLQSHGGPTETLALLSDGPATDAGSNILIPIDPNTSTAFTTDQRGTGFDRIVNGTVDIGAFEVQPTTPYENWITASFPGVIDPAIIGHDANPSGDGLSNILKFAFGLNPKISDTKDLTITDATTFTKGQPVGHLSENPSNFSARFVRLKEHLANGVTYTIEFSSDLSVWEISSASPTVISDDGGDYEVVEVDSPDLVNGGIPTFFRLGVSNTP